MLRSAFLAFAFQHLLFAPIFNQADSPHQQKQLTLFKVFSHNQFSWFLHYLTRRRRRRIVAFLFSSYLLHVRMIVLHDLKIMQISAGPGTCIYKSASRTQIKTQIFLCVSISAQWQRCKALHTV